MSLSLSQIIFFYSANIVFGCNTFVIEFAIDDIIRGGVYTLEFTQI